MQPTPFVIRVADDVLADLRERLGRVRWPDEVAGAGRQYGTDLHYLKEVVGIHLNFIGFLRELSRPDNPTPEEAQYLAELQHWITEDSACGQIQGTRPQTLAYAAFPREIMRPPRSIVALKFNVQRWRAMPRGGHFAALEQPDLLAEDIRAFLRSRF